MPIKGFAPQFPERGINHHSIGTVLIELLSKDGLDSTISHGTGFLWLDEQKSFWLVTARHVFSGTNPFDGSDITEKAFVPQKIRAHLGVKLSSDSFSRKAFEFEISGESGPRWAQDPEFDSLKTDIAALPIKIAQTDLVALNDHEDFDKYNDLFTEIGFPCFVIGYPTTEVEGLMVPVWRAGAIASDPSLAIDGKPIFLVDAATGPGFSGSPVFRSHIGPAPFVDPRVEHGIRIDGSAVARASFVGVYAGRLNHKHVGAQTPYVFFANRVPVIVGKNADMESVNPCGGIETHLAAGNFAMNDLVARGSGIEFDDNPGFISIKLPK